MMTNNRNSSSQYVDYSLMSWLRVPKLLRLYRVRQVCGASGPLYPSVPPHSDLIPP